MKSKSRDLFENKKCLGKYILKRTLYHDFDCDYLTDDKPNGVFKKDYDVFRFGSVFECYEIDEDIRIEYDIFEYILEEYNYIMISKNRRKSILLQDAASINFSFALYIKKAK